MKYEGAYSDDEIRYESDQEDLIMAMLQVISDALVCKPGEEQVGKGVDYFS